MSCLTALSGAFSMLLNRSVKSRHPCLVLSLRGKALVLSSLGMMSCCTCHWLGWKLFRVCWGFQSSLYVEYCQMFFLHLLGSSYMLLFFSLSTCLITLIASQVLKQPCIYWKIVMDYLFLHITRFHLLIFGWRFFLIEMLVYGFLSL